MKRSQQTFRYIRRTDRKPNWTNHHIVLNGNAATDFYFLWNNKIDGGVFEFPDIGAKSYVNVVPKAYLVVEVHHYDSLIKLLQEIHPRKIDLMRQMFVGIASQTHLILR